MVEVLFQDFARFTWEFENKTNIFIIIYYYDIMFLVHG